MKCVKTGLQFQIRDREYDGTFVGDLFYHTELNVYILRGIPQGTSTCDPDIVYCRHGSTYFPIVMTEEIKVHWRDWVPETVEMVLPTIIDDTRFF